MSNLFNFFAYLTGSTSTSPSAKEDAPSTSKPVQRTVQVPTPPPTPETPRSLASATAILTPEDQFMDLPLAENLPDDLSSRPNAWASPAPSSSPSPNVESVHSPVQVTETRATPSEGGKRKCSPHDQETEPQAGPSIQPRQVKRVRFADTPGNASTQHAGGSSLRTGSLVARRASGEQRRSDRSHHGRASTRTMSASMTTQQLASPPNLSLSVSNASIRRRRQLPVTPPPSPPTIPATRAGPGSLRREPAGFAIQNNSVWVIGKPSHGIEEWTAERAAARYPFFEPNYYNNASGLLNPDFTAPMAPPRPTRQEPTSFFASSYREAPLNPPRRSNAQPITPTRPRATPRPPSGLSFPPLVFPPPNPGPPFYPRALLPLPERSRRQDVPHDVLQREAPVQREDLPQYSPPPPAYEELFPGNAEAGPSGSRPSGSGASSSASGSGSGQRYETRTTLGQRGRERDEDLELGFEERPTQRRRIVPPLTSAPAQANGGQSSSTSTPRSHHGSRLSRQIEEARRRRGAPPK